MLEPVFERVRPPRDIARVAQAAHDAARARLESERENVDRALVRALNAARPRIHGMLRMALPESAVDLIRGRVDIALDGLRARVVDDEETGEPLLRLVPANDDDERVLRALQAGSQSMPMVDVAGPLAEAFESEIRPIIERISEGR